jgi:hypothetical protein
MPQTRVRNALPDLEDLPFEDQPVVTWNFDVVRNPYQLYDIYSLDGWTFVRLDVWYIVFGDDDYRIHDVMVDDLDRVIRFTASNDLRYVDEDEEPVVWQVDRSVEPAVVRPLEAN